MFDSFFPQRMRSKHAKLTQGTARLLSVIYRRANLNDNKLIFGDIDLYGLRFHIKTYKGEEKSNLDVFVDSFDTKSHPKYIGTQEILQFHK